MFVTFQRAAEDVKAVAHLLGTGLSDYEISRRTGISRSSIQRWRTRGAPREACDSPPLWREPNPRSYGYLPRPRSSRSWKPGREHLYGRPQEGKQSAWSQQAGSGPCFFLSTDPARSTNEQLPWLVGSKTLSMSSRRSSSAASSMPMDRESSIDSKSSWCQVGVNTNIRATSLRISQLTSGACFAHHATRLESTGLNRATRTSQSPTGERGHARLIRGAEELMRAEGLEPPSSFEHWHLKPACLPNFTTPAWLLQSRA